MNQPMFLKIKVSGMRLSLFDFEVWLWMINPEMPYFIAYNFSILIPIPGLNVSLKGSNSNDGLLRTVRQAAKQ